MNNVPTKRCYKFIRFDDMTSTGCKTQLFHCKSIRGDDLLGVVAYLSAWRQFVFQPNPLAEFSSSCLLDVVDFLNQINGKSL